MAEKWKQVTGPLIEGYGLDRDLAGATINPLTITDYNGSIGLPVPSTEISIRDDDGKEVALGEPGEIACAAAGDEGYWNKPEETAKVIMADGFLRTGDVAVVDEQGFARIVDRKKDMILVSGFQIVYPNEIEGCCRHAPRRARGRRGRRARRRVWRGGGQDCRRQERPES